MALTRYKTTLETSLTCFKARWLSHWSCWPFGPRLPRETTRRGWSGRQGAWQAPPNCRTRAYPENEFGALRRACEHVVVGGFRDVSAVGDFADIARQKRAGKRRLADVGMADQTQMNAQGINRHHWVSLVSEGAAAFLAAELSEVSAALMALSRRSLCSFCLVSFVVGSSAFGSAGCTSSLRAVEESSAAGGFVRGVLPQEAQSRLRQVRRAPAPESAPEPGFRCRAVGRKRGCLRGCPAAQLLDCGKLLVGAGLEDKSVRPRLWAKALQRSPRSLMREESPRKCSENSVRSRQPRKNGAGRHVAGRSELFDHKTVRVDFGRLHGIKPERHNGSTFSAVDGGNGRLRVVKVPLRRRPNRLPAPSSGARA